MAAIANVTQPVLGAKTNTDIAACCFVDGE
jgi:hypothetical protein